MFPFNEAEAFRFALMISTWTVDFLDEIFCDFIGLGIQFS